MLLGTCLKGGLAVERRGEDNRMDGRWSRKGMESAVVEIRVGEMCMENFSSWFG